MQQLLVVFLLAIAAFLLSRRLWRFFRSAGDTSCSCGCSGCPPAKKAAQDKQSLPMFRP